MPERSIGSEMDDVLYGWDTCITGPIETVTLRGNHFSLFDEDNIELIADAIYQAT
ncbi:MAG: hypothetical protein QM756_41935 [Polyangiaceae bacterium]